MPSEAKGVPTREIAGEPRRSCVWRVEAGFGQTIPVLCEPARAPLIFARDRLNKELKPDSH